MELAPVYDLKPITRSTIAAIDDVMAIFIFSNPIFIKWLHGFNYTRAPKFTNNNDAYRLLFSPRRRLIAVSGGELTQSSRDRAAINNALCRYFQKLVMGYYFSIGNRFLQKYGTPIYSKGTKKQILYDVDYWTIKLCLELEYAEVCVHSDPACRVFSQGYIPEDLFASIYMEMRQVRNEGSSSVRHLFENFGIKVKKVLNRERSYSIVRHVERTLNEMEKIIEQICVEILLDMPLVKIYSLNGEESLSESVYSKFRESFEEDDYRERKCEDTESSTNLSEPIQICGSDFLRIDVCINEEHMVMGAPSVDMGVIGHTSEEASSGYTQLNYIELQVETLLNALKTVGGSENRTFINNIEELRIYLLSKFTFIPVDPIADLRVTIMRGRMEETINFRRLDYRRSPVRNAGIVGTRMDILKPRVIFIRDTSGSMSDEECIVGMNIIYSCMGVEKKSRVIQFDVGVTLDDLIDIGDLESVKKIGSNASRGGTTFKPVIQYLKDKKVEYDVALILTDGYFSDYRSGEQVTPGDFTGTPVFLLTNAHTVQYLHPNIKTVCGFFDVVRQHMPIV